MITTYTRPEEYRRPRRSVRLLQHAGFLNSRNLYWSWYKAPNFGDWVGPYLFEKMTGIAPLFYRPRRGALGTSVLTAGSILRHMKVPDRFIVWGSGIISESDQVARPKEVRSLRGPYSRDFLHALGYPTSEVFGDPAILLPKFLPVRSSKRHRLGIIPHYFDYERVREEFGKMDDVKVINVCRPITDVVEEIVSCEATLSSSLHGVIVSHSYGIPCGWISSGTPLQGDDIKFKDYYHSDGNRPKVSPISIAASARVQELVALARNSPRPEIERLQRTLLEVCPHRTSGRHQARIESNRREVS